MGKKEKKSKKVRTSTCIFHCQTACGMCFLRSIDVVFWGSISALECQLMVFIYYCVIIVQDKDEKKVKKEKKEKKRSREAIEEVKAEEVPSATKESKKARKEKKEKREEKEKKEKKDKKEKSKKEKKDVKKELESHPLEGDLDQTEEVEEEVEEDEEAGTAAKAFQRVKADEWIGKRGSWDNSYEGTFGQAGWGFKAQQILGKVRGKDFRHEKTKKKRGSYRGGLIDSNAVSSYKFDSDDD